jgi:hypothetical protein
MIKRSIVEVSGCAGKAAQGAAFRGVEWCPERPGSFLADPFGYLDDGCHIHLFAEVYDRRRNIGEICHLTYDGKSFTEPTPVLKSAHHLSYPFVFIHDGSTFVAPEHSGARDFSTFVIGCDGNLVGKRTIVGDLPLLDGTLLFKGDTYWLFALDETVTRNTDLHIYFADSLDGPWQAHPMNPVKSDVRSARPAGTPFFHEAKLYRPGQDCSTHYGRAITVSRVDELTRTTYRETRVSEIQPADRQYGYGLHTIAQVGDSTLVDGARLKPVYPLLSRALAGLVGLKLIA